MPFRLDIDLGKWKHPSYYPSGADTLESAIADAKTGSKADWVEWLTFFIGFGCPFTWIVTFIFEHGRRVHAKELKQLIEFRDHGTVAGLPAVRVPMKGEDRRTGEISGSISEGSIALKLLVHSVIFFIGYMLLSILALLH